VKHSRKSTFPLARKAEKALKEAVKQAMIEHKLSGDPIVVWRNGKVVWIPAEKIPVRIPKKKLRKLQAVLKSEKAEAKVTAKQFDEQFEKGNVSGMLDMDSASIQIPSQRINIDIPKPVLNRIDLEANRIGVTRTSLIKMWIAQHLKIG